MAKKKGAQPPSAFALFIRNLAITRAGYRVVAGYLFHRYFRAVAVAASNEDLKNENFRIRYDVYCSDLHLEDPANFPDKREIDSFDQFSLHSLLYHDASDTYAGCVRVVLANPERPDDLLPFEKLCRATMYPGIMDELVPDRTKIGEISRLAVRSSFRRRKNESSVPMVILEKRKKAFTRARTPWIALGLYLSAAALGVIKGLDGVFAMMEPSLARRLRSYGLKFVQVGAPVEHRGQRAPYYMSRVSLYAGVPLIVRGLLDVVEADLRRTGAENMMLCKPSPTVGFDQPQPPSPAVVQVENPHLAHRSQGAAAALPHPEDQRPAAAVPAETH
ncbi:MAG: PEP-CTERM/exosortase system-associated acyltransferase [Pseudoxanthomonas sp.]|nr:PEP-CTERM/exosortase system-associated acyltransferase [Pseudoxanthomonas sp.]